MYRDEDRTQPLIPLEPQPAPIIAVNGASGLIGRQVVAALQQAGCSLRLLTRQPHAEQAGITWIQGDLFSPQSLRDLVRGANAVVHLAGVAHTTLNSAAEREHAYATNVGGTRSLAQACLSAGTPRFVLMSSAHVYAGQMGTDLDENSPTAGDSPYALMKLEAEAAVLEMAANSGCHAAILRPCLVYGPGVRFNLESLLRAVRRGYYVHAGSIRVVRSMASVDTVVTAVLHMLSDVSCEGIYNVADREAVLLRDWVNHLADMMRVRRPKTLPLGLLRMMAAMGSAAKSISLPALLTRDSLEKLTVSFSLDVSKLAATGFAWPENNDAVLQRMIYTTRT
jgi:nucleoside-diphosphate-sugar epimerase